MLILIILLLYFILLLAVGHIKGRTASNGVFFLADRRSPWYAVAFGMIGASISGVTFISVPGMVLTQDMTYLQMCLGFIAGYFVVAFILLPIYYKMRLTTIYSYLLSRFGIRSYTTGASFFFLSKMAGAAVRFYIVCKLLQIYVFDSFGIPFAITAILLLLLIWLYTRQGGIGTIVWTDTLQTGIMFAALIMIIYGVMSQMDITLSEAVSKISESRQSRIFVFNDWTSRQYFWKQFLSGVFVVIVMTGLDQDMMQKSLTCRTLRESQKNICSYAFAFVPANLLYLSLGVLLCLYANSKGIALPSRGDDLLPMFAATGMLGSAVLSFFAIGIVASAFSSADSALTAHTTTLCVNLFRKPDDTQFRRAAHLVVIILFITCVLLVDAAGSSSVIDTIYVLCGYTYGPLLGLFFFGITTHLAIRDRYVPLVCISSPIICFTTDAISKHFFGYSFGYELLMLNGFLTYAGCLVISKKTVCQHVA